MTSHVETREIVDVLETLPPDKVAEVRDFVDFLAGRYGTKPAVDETDDDLRRAAMSLSEQAFADVWDNPRDAVYDSL